MPWSEKEAVEIAKAFAVACEVIGTSFSAPARVYMLSELESLYPAHLVMAGLMRAPRMVTGNLTMAAVVRAVEWQDRKSISDISAAKSAYLTCLRGCALTESIAWESGIEAVENALTAKGYKLHKMPGFCAREVHVPVLAPGGEDV